MTTGGPGFPLSPLQQGMLFHHLADPHSGVDIEQIVVSLPEAVEGVALRRAWQALATRHDVLRTSFHWKKSERPLQVVAESCAVPFREEDWRNAARSERHARLEAFLRSDRRAGFTLDVAPLWRVALVRVDDAAYELVWTLHHALMDGRSFGPILRDVFAFYERARAGGAITAKGTDVLDNVREPRGDRLAGGAVVSYRAHVAWLEAQDFAAAEPLWRARLRGLRAPTPLPAADPQHRLPAKGARQRERDSRLARASTSALHDVARRHDVTLGTLVHAAWGLALGRHSGEPEVVFGATRAARRSSVPGADAILGLFINTLPVRLRIDEEQSLATWLHDVRAAWTELRDVEQTPLALVQSWSDVPAGTPLFESIVVYEHRSLEETLRALGGAWAHRSVRLLEQTNYPLTLAAYGDERLYLRLQYDPERFDDATIERVLGHVTTILEGIAASDPAQRVADVPWLTAAEAQQLRHWSIPRTDYASDVTLVELFERQVARDPTRIALSFENQRLTYGALQKRARHFAEALVARGVTPGSGVALCLERSLELVVAIVGTLEAGAYYVPLDPAYPAERLSFMLDDAGPSLVVTAAELRAQLPAGPANVVLFEELDARRASAKPQSARPRATADDPAYVIYTSGSTGKPKGTRATHRNVVRLLAATRDVIGSGDAEVWTLFHSYAFDFSVWEMWGCLAYGGRLVVVPYWVTRSSGEFRTLLGREAVTVLNQTPSAFWQLVHADASGDAALGALRIVLLGGEAVDLARLAPWFERYGDERPRVFNGYGPTELTIFTTVRRLQAADLHSALRSPIGRPLADLRAYVLDRRGGAVPIGVAGELYVGGPGLTAGYMNRPALTAQRFLPDPDAPHPGAQRYRTGDCVRRLADGEFDYVGRNDAQVKIRGFRIEPAEVEAALLAEPDVAGTVVVAREIAPGDTRLVAYVVPRVGAAFDAEALRQAVGSRLPRHFVPARFVEVTALPLTENGKIDRARLPDPGAIAVESRKVDALPSTPLERTLASIWSAVLRVENVGVHDNFFELGGDSILTIGIVSRAREAGVRLTPRQLFDHPTIAALTPHLSTRAASQIVAENPPARRGEADVPLSPIARWFFEAHGDDPNYWNQAFLFEVPADFDTAALREAARQLVAHHDALRLRFVRDREGWKATYAVPGDVPVERADLADVADDALPAALEAFCVDAQRRLDIAHGPLVRFMHASLGAPRGGRLLVAIHHLVVDGVSWSVLVEDLEKAYRAAQRGESPALGPKTTSVAQWAARLAKFARTSRVRSSAWYWNGVVASPLRALPLDRNEASADLEGDTQTHTVRLSAAQTRALLGSAPAQLGCRINDVLLASLAAALGEWVEPGAVLVDVEGHGREDLFEDVDLSRTLGWFTTIFPVRLELPGESPLEALGALVPQLRALPQRGLGYGLLRYLGDAPAVGESGAEIAFNYLGQFDRVVADSALFRFAPESTGPWHGPANRRRYRIEINSLVLGGAFEARWTFNPNFHDITTIERLAGGFAAALQTLIDAGRATTAPPNPPSDESAAGSAPQAAGEGHGSASLDAIARRDPSAPAPLSLAQETVWLIERASPGSAAYNSSVARRICGPLDVAALRAAFDGLVARHEALRTVIDASGDTPLLAVRPASAVPVALHDVRDLPEPEREAAGRAFLEKLAAQPFDLERDLPLRVGLVRVGDDEHLLLLLTHHLASDAWSYGIIFRDLATLYAAARDRRPPALAPPRLQFADFAVWQRRSLQHESLEQRAALWRERLGAMPPLEVPTDRVRAPVPNSNGARCTLLLAPAVLASLREAARRQHATVYAVLLGAYAAVLHRLAGAEDVVVGSAVAGRARRELEEIVGYFSQALPMRVSFTGEPALAEVVERAAEASAFALEHHDVPFEAIVPSLALPRDAHAPLFRVVLTMQDSLRDELRLGDAAVEPFEVQTGATKFDLTLLVTERRDGLELALWYRTDLFERETVERFLERMQFVLAAIVSDPRRPVAELDLLSSRERAQLTEWNATSRHFEGFRTVREAIAGQCRRVPNATAVICGEGTLTYEQLRRAVLRIGARLRTAGVVSGDAVAIYLERSSAALVAMLGAWEAGAAYVPIATEAPPARIALQLAQAGVKCAVTTSALRDRLPHELTIVALGEENGRPEDGAAFVHDGDPERPASAVTSRGPSEHDGAYVLFTSGSTGVPKGVAVTHGNLANYTHAITERLGLGDARGLHFASVSSLTTDLGNTAIFPALCAGATLHLVPNEIATDAARFAAYTATQPLDILKITPTHCAALLAAADGRAAFLPRRALVLGGEVCPWELVERLAAAGTCRILNHYGPTETTVGACTFEFGKPPLDRSTTATVPIGKPLANVRTYVLDRSGQLVPVGVTGELYIGGAGVARGYDRRPDLTAERFVTERFSADSTARMYRTGDRVRRLPSGDLEFLGRFDDQVKLRGYRIELAEVEAVLRDDPRVAGCAVTLVGGPSADARLIAYVVPRDADSVNGAAPAPAPNGAPVPITTESVLARLAERLPPYMLPSAVVLLERLPLGSSGKVDRAALPPVDAGDGAGAVYVAPRTETEAAVAKVWEEVLRRERIGVSEDFLAAGGQSILAIRVLGKLARRFGVRLSLRMLFDAGTVEVLAREIDSARNGVAVGP